MKTEHDSLDLALSSLRSQQWNGAAFDPELEEKLMKNFGVRGTLPRFVLHPAFTLGLAILAIGGGAFAATGGLAKLSGWLYRVTINGREVTLVAADGKPASMTFETADGKTGTIHLMKTEVDGGEKVAAAVIAHGPSTCEETKFEALRSVWTSQADGATTSLNIGEVDPAVLGEAEPRHTWTMPDGQAGALYAIRDADGLGTLYLKLTGAGNVSKVRKLVTLPAAVSAGLDDMQVTTDADGNATLISETADGQKRVIKLRTSTKMHIAPGDAAPKELNLDTPSGPVQIKIERTPVEN